MWNLWAFEEADEGGPRVQLGRKREKAGLIPWPEG